MEWKYLVDLFKIGLCVFDVGSDVLSAQALSHSHLAEVNKIGFLAAAFLLMVPVVNFFVIRFHRKSHVPLYKEINMINPNFDKFVQIVALSLKPGHAHFDAFTCALLSPVTAFSALRETTVRAHVSEQPLEQSFRNGALCCVWHCS